MRRLSTLVIAGLIASAGAAALAAPGGAGGMGAMPSMSAPAYDPSADYAAGVAALQANQYREAARALQKVTNAVPKDPEAWRLLGTARAGESDWKGARKAYENAVKLAPDDYRAHAGLGLALANLKDAKAQGELDWLTARSKACGGCAEAADLKTAADQLQGALAGGGKPTAALESPMIFAGAAAGDAAYDRAVGLINEHRYDEAIATLKSAEAVFGPHPDILTYEGYAWRKKGEFDRAETYYRQALAIDPAHRGASEYYGELKVERGDMAGARTLLARLDKVCTYGCAEAEELRRWIELGRDPQRP